jgi:YidC/Oxa1 family membrane protein insertase
VDRNAVTATILITLIIFGWMYFFSPPPPPPASSEAAQEDSLLVTDDLAEVDEPPSLRSADDEDAVDDAFASATQGQEQIVTVEHDLYTARFSTQGARLVSFVLKDYVKADRETPVDLIDTTAERSGLSLSWTTPQSRNVSASRFFFEPTTSGSLAEGDSLVVAFEAGLGGGTLRQVYTFYPDTYEIGWTIGGSNLDRVMVSGGYEVGWSGAIPFTEESKEEEIRRAGVYARSGGEIEEFTVASEDSFEETLTGQVDWVAVKSKYFAAVIIPTERTEAAYLDGIRVGEITSPDVEENFRARVEVASLSGGETDRFRLYLGPLEYDRISAFDLGLYQMVDLGYNFLDWITRPLARFVFIPLFTFFATFIPNYGVIIILFALLVKIVTHPLQAKSMRSMAGMRDLQPKMQEIKEKYEDDPQKQQQAMMKLYREAGVNPLGGCLPMLLQYPIIIALWQFLPQFMDIRQEEFLWANDLSAPDAILQLPFEIPLYGDFVAGFTVLMGLAMVVQMQIQMRSQPANPQMKMFTYLLPIMLFVFFNKQAAGLSLYYLFYNVFTAIQQQWINHQIDKRKTIAPEASPVAERPSGKAARPRPGAQRNGALPAGSKTSGRKQGKRKR